MGHVFISYSSTDWADFVQQFAEDLRAANLDVWLDRWEISGRKPYWEEIKGGIEDCSHFLFVISPDSIETNSNPLTELYHAFSLRPHKVIVPVLAKETPFSAFPLPITPGKLQTHDFVRKPREQALREVIRALQIERSTPPNSAQKQRLEAEAALRPSVISARQAARTSQLGVRRSSRSLVVGLATLVPLLLLGFGGFWLLSQQRRADEQATQTAIAALATNTETNTATESPTRQATASVTIAVTATTAPTAAPTEATTAVPSGAIGGGTGVFAFSRDGSLYLANIDGTNERLLYGTPAAESAVPVWSPDGTRIAFRVDPYEAPEIANADIFVISADGSNLQQITYLAADIANPSWSPDGTLLVFRMGDSDGNREIMVLKMNELERAPVNLTAHPDQDLQPVWSRDGQYIYFSSQRPQAAYSIFRMKPDGSGVEQVVNNGFNNYQPDLSPDAQWLAYSSSISRDGGRGILIANTFGKGARNIFSDGRTHQAPVFSPDSRWLLFFTTPGSGQPGAPSVIQLISVDGGTPTVVINGEFPAWQPLPPASD